MSAYPVTGGLWGKLPACGDFVRLGLSRGFTDAWDTWMSAALVDSRRRLGAAWQAAWMVAPVWRFSLGACVCGPDAVLGVWMPSVDSAGRAYPLTLAAIVPGTVDLAGQAATWLDAAEEAGIAALENRLEPEAVVARLAAVNTSARHVSPSLSRSSSPSPGSSWLTKRRALREGKPFSSSAFSLPCLPPHPIFCSMLQ